MLTTPAASDPFAGLATSTSGASAHDAPDGPPPTDGQVKFYTDLLRRKGGCDQEEVDRRVAKRKAEHAWTRSSVSKAIDKLKAMPDREGDGATKEEPPEGFHLLDDQIYSVKRAVHGSGMLVGRRLQTENAEAVKAAWKEWDDGGRHGRQPKLDWDYVGRKGAFWKLSEATLLTKEQLQAMGHLYGICCRCGACLTKQESIDRGMGPVCASKF